jgi:hypothetical protein
MSEEERLRSERLVEIHRARNEWQGNLLVGYLGENGVEATLRLPIAIPPLDAVEVVSGTDNACGVFVLEHEAKRATDLVKEFLLATTDESIWEQAAIQNPQVNKEIK